MSVRQIPIDGRANGYVHNANAQGVRRATASGAAYVLPGGTLYRRQDMARRARAVDQSKVAFGWTYAGNVVTVYPGTVWLDTVKCHLPKSGSNAWAAQVECTSQYPCVFVSVPRTGGTPTVAEIDETVTYSGQGVGPDDTHVRFTIACFDRSSGSLVLVRGGAGYVAFSPA